jgi:hypothetical protein
VCEIGNCPGVNLYVDPHKLSCVSLLSGSCGASTIAEYADLYQYCVVGEHTISITAPSDVDISLIKRLALFEIQVFFLALNNQDLVQGIPDHASVQEIATALLTGDNGLLNSEPVSKQLYLRFEYPIAVSVEMRLSLAGVSEVEADFNEANRAVLIDTVTSFLAQYLNQSKIELDEVEIVSVTPLSALAAANEFETRRRLQDVKNLTLPPGQTLPPGTAESLNDKGMNVEMSVRSFCAGADACTDDALANVVENVPATGTLSEADLEEELRQEAANRATDYFNSLFNVSMTTADEVVLVPNVTKDIPPVDSDDSGDEASFPPWLYASLLGMGLVLLSSMLFVCVVVRRSRQRQSKRVGNNRKATNSQQDEGQEVPYSPQPNSASGVGATAPPAPPSTSSFYDDDDRRLDNLDSRPNASVDQSYDLQSFEQEESVYTTTTTRPFAQY